MGVKPRPRVLRLRIKVPFGGALNKALQLTAR